MGQPAPLINLKPSRVTRWKQLPSNTNFQSPSETTLVGQVPPRWGFDVVFTDFILICRLPGIGSQLLVFQLILLPATGPFRTLF